MALFNKMGINDRQMAHTRLRKCFSTNLEELANPEEMDDLDKVMSHWKDTRKRCYIHRKCTKMTSKEMRTMANKPHSIKGHLPH